MNREGIDRGRVCGGPTRGKLASHPALGAGYTGGVRLAVGDVSRDGYADVVTRGRVRAQVFTGEGRADPHVASATGARVVHFPTTRPTAGWPVVEDVGGVYVG